MAIETTRDLCLSVADAIREKKGSSDLINPQDFAKEIASIEGGGSGGGGESGEWHYYRIPEPVAMNVISSPTMAILFSLVKCRMQGQSTTIVCPIFFNDKYEILEFAANFDSIITDVANLDSPGYCTMGEMLQRVGGYEGLGLSTTEITESQFYDLNA